MTYASSKSPAPSRARRIERTALAVLLAVSLPAAGVLTAANDSFAQTSSAAPRTAGVQENLTPKSEVVYANLSGSGAPDDAYVVNIMEPEAPGTVTDFGTYESVENLTDASEISVAGDAVVMEVAGDSMSYEGALGSVELPWNIDISHTLDGAAVSAEELGGASGEWEMQIRTTRNDAVQAGYFDNYLMQISVTLDAQKAKDVVAPDAQIARAGSSLQLTFMAMPEKDGSFTVRANVSDFEMAGISFAAIPLSLAIEAPNTDELISGFDQLAGGVRELASGASDLAQGTGELASGAEGVSLGISSVTVSLQQIVDGARGVASGLSAYQQALVGSSQQESELVIGEDELAKQLAGAFSQFMTSYSQAYSAAYVPAYLKAQSEGDDPESAAAKAAQSASWAALLDEGVMEAMGSVQAAMTAMAESAGHQGASQALLQAADGLGTAQDSATLLGAAEALAGGLSSLHQGTSELSSGAQELAAGAGRLDAGADALSSGVQTLSTEVQAMPAAVKQQIDDMMAGYDKSGYVPESFTSGKNANVKLVQFVMTSADIVAPEEPEPEKAEPEQGFIDRLLALFR